MTTYKCLVLDLDGTLWDGVAGEEGTVTPYTEFQQIVLQLYKRGVILAINSKNHWSTVLEVFQREDMILGMEHFSAWQINWRDKAENMRRLAEVLNIGLDSMVFVDDNSVEREWVRQSLPEVLVIEPGELRELTAFEALGLTDEDRQRSEMYAAERKRRELAESLTYDEFLASLQMELTLEQCQPDDVPRVGQLARRVNQFNMTTKRYTDCDISRMIHNVYTLRVTDKFGDCGLVGVAILDGNEIDTFLLSCRVLGRGVEFEFLRLLVDYVKLDTIVAQFIPTEKNKPAQGFYAEFGFKAENGKWQWNRS